MVDLPNKKLGKELKPEYKENPIKNYVMHALADTSKIEGLGFKPKYSLEEGLNEILDFNSNYPHDIANSLICVLRHNT